jgi:hypothetical protein
MNTLITSEGRNVNVEIKLAGIETYKSTTPQTMLITVHVD